MKLLAYGLSIVLACLPMRAVQAADTSVKELRSSGAFGFPAAMAKTLCDIKGLRVQAWNDKQNLMVQAIVWNDSSEQLGETSDGRPVGDSSTLIIDTNADGKKTAKVDRSYSLNPWPSIPGLRYSILYERGSSHIKGDSTGRGSIRYLSLKNEGRVRVDTYVIPFSELDLKVGQTVGVGLYVSSTKPEMTMNSVGFTPSRSKYYSFSLPWENFSKVQLAASDVEFDVSQIPAGREDEKKDDKPRKAQPKVGSAPPEIVASDWLNSDKVTLAELKGKVVLIDFWATWCGPCVKGIPHLNKLHDQHKDDGLVILSFTNQSRRGIENFLKKVEMKYPVGTGSSLADEYGVVGLPHTFLIDRSGKVVWHDTPTQEKLDQEIAKVLAK